MISWQEFEKVEIRVGQVVNCELIKGAKYSTHLLIIDFGGLIGPKQSCARLVNYPPESLVGRQVLAVVNFPSKQIGKHLSEVLTLGVPDEQGNCVLIEPEREVPPGGRLY